MLHRMLSIRASLALVAAGFVVLSAAAIALPHDPYIRWQSLKGTIFESVAYFYERLHYDPASIDVVIIGSSRSQVGLSAPMLEADMKEQGRTLRVLNMSVAAAGMDLRVVEAREAFRAHPEIKLLVIPVVEALPRDGHQAFASLATLDDISDSPWLINRNLPATWLGLPMRQMSLFAATQAPQAFGYKPAFDPARYPGTAVSNKAMPGWQPQLPAHPVGTAGHRKDLDEETVIRSKDATPPILPASMADFEFGVSREAVRQLAELAKAHRAKLVFLFQPYYKGLKGPAERAWLEQYGPVWSYLSHMDEPDYFRDAGHPSDRALPELNSWMARQIIAALPPVSSPAKPE